MPTADRRIVKTRRAIAEAFWQLMQERDFRDISVNDVTAAAQISRTTFYHHYTDKFHWLEQTILAYLREVTSGYHVQDLHSKEQVIQNLTGLFRSISSHPQMCTLIMANENTQLLYCFFRDSLLEQYHARYGPDARLTPEEDLTAHYLSTTLSALVEWWVRNNTLFSPEHLAQCIYSFHHMDEKKT